MVKIKKIPEGCHLDEDGNLICEEKSKKKAVAPVPKGTPKLFGNAEVEFTSLKCKENKKTGKVECTGTFESDERPRG